MTPYLSFDGRRFGLEAPFPMSIETINIESIILTLSSPTATITVFPPGVMSIISG